MNNLSNKICPGIPSYALYPLRRIGGKEYRALVVDMPMKTVLFNLQFEIPHMPLACREGDHLVASESWECVSCGEELDE